MDDFQVGDAVAIGKFVPMSAEMLTDATGVDVMAHVRELLTYGRPRTHQPSMFPKIVLFPRLERATHTALRFRSRIRDAVSAFRYGLPEQDDD